MHIMHTTSRQPVSKCIAVRSCSGWSPKDLWEARRLLAKRTKTDSQGMDRLLQANPKTFKGLHFSSHTPQRLFDAACCQGDLEELRFKWGNYKDLSALENLHSLKFLLIGSGAGVQDIASICNIKSLVVLSIENFKRVEDYSPLIALEDLEQLEIHSNIMGRIAIKDLEFLREMPSLRSFATGATTFRKKYTEAELKDLFASLPKLEYAFVNGKAF